MGAKRVSSDKSYSFIFDIAADHEIESSTEIKNSSYAVCLYDEKAWLGLVVEKGEKECEVKFMHPAFPVRSYTLHGLIIMISVV